MLIPFKIAVICATLLISGVGSAAQGTSGSVAHRTADSAQQGEIDQIAREAQGAYSKGDWEDAIRGYEKLIRLASGVPEYHLNLGIACYSAGRSPDAIRPLQQALKLKPSLAQAHFYLGVSLGEAGRCRDALPFLKKDLPRVTDRHLKRALGLSGVKCAVSLNRLDDAVDFMRVLNRDFSSDPEVLYRAVHLYSDLSSRASEQLLYKAPTSYQVRELNAEALEAQGKWEEAAKEYHRILEQNPNLPGIHYRLGRMLLSAPETATTKADARREFEQELKLDPGNAAAEFVLGELDFQSGKVEESVARFTRAVKLDAGFTDAFLELGRALISIGKSSEALSPLETAVKLQPENPIAHFRLSTAYARLGRRDEAQKEITVYQELSEKERQAKEALQKAVSGVPQDKPE